MNGAEIGPDLEWVLFQARGQRGDQPGFTLPPPFHQAILCRSDL